jgi:hypothetical protein
MIFPLAVHRKPIFGFGNFYDTKLNFICGY